MEEGGDDLQEIPEQITEGIEPKSLRVQDDIIVIPTRTHKPLKQTMSNLSAVLVSGENFQIASPHIENEEEVRHIYKESIKRQRVSASLRVRDDSSSINKQALVMSKSLNRPRVNGKRSTKKRPLSIRLLENRAKLADFHLKSLRKKANEENVEKHPQVKTESSNDFPVPNTDGAYNLAYVNEEEPEIDNKNTQESK